MSSSPFQLDLSGAKELIAALRELPAKVERKVLRQAMRAGANLQLAEIRRSVPRDSGKGVKEITVRAAPKLRRGNVGVVITTGDAFYLRMIEHGWMKAPTIRLANGNFISLSKKDAQRLGMSPTHMPPRPFMQPAFDRTKDQASAAIIDKLASGIEREAGA